MLDNLTEKEVIGMNRFYGLATFLLARYLIRFHKIPHVRCAALLEDVRIYLQCTRMERRIFLNRKTSRIICVAKRSNEPTESTFRAWITFSMLSKGHLALVHHGHRRNLLVLSLHLSHCGEDVFEPQTSIK